MRLTQEHKKNPGGQNNSNDPSSPPSCFSDASEGLRTGTLLLSMEESHHIFLQAHSGVVPWRKAVGRMHGWMHLLVLDYSTIWIGSGYSCEMYFPGTKSWGRNKQDPDCKALLSIVHCYWEKNINVNRHIFRVGSSMERLTEMNMDLHHRGSQQKRNRLNPCQQNLSLLTIKMYFLPIRKPYEIIFPS